MNSQSELFKGKTVKEYTTIKHNECQKTIESMTDEEILYGDFETWVKYYVNRYTLQPVVIYYDNIRQNLDETKIKARNIGYSYYSDLEPEFYEIPGYKIDFIIPFSGDYNLLYLQPSTMILAKFTVSDFIKPNSDTCGSFTLSLQFTEQDLIGNKENLEEYVSRHFDEKFNTYQSMVGYVNQEIVAFNKRLESRVVDWLTERKNRGKHKKEICNLLHIPLKMKSDAPNLNPVPIKIIPKKYVKPPEIVKVPMEYSISDQDYDNILKIIHQCCTAMEATSRTHGKYEEEELRDSILATLGTHYQNNTWGETFRRKGKTDILIPFENKAAFIAECKIWHGIKRFEDAVNQLISYSTWKDVKVAIVLFNKTNRDFLAVIKKLDDWIKKNTDRHEKKQKNCWRCIIHKEERNINFEVTICIYELSIKS